MSEVSSLDVINNNPKIHNKLARAKYAMNVSEQKLFLYAVRNIDQSANGFPESKFNIMSFAKYADLDETRLYKDIDKMTTSLMQTIIHIEDDYDKEKWIKYNLTKKCKYVNGIITFRFNDDMKSLLLGLQKHYFRQAPEIMGFSSWYSFRIYDFIKSETYKNKPTKVELSRFKEILDIEDKYSSFSDLRKRVIEPAIDEINEHSDISVSYEKITKGRSVIGLKFSSLNEVVEDYTELLVGMYNIQEFKDKIGLTPKALSDVQIIELYDIAVSVFKRYRDMDDLYEYMRISYAYTKEKKPQGNPYYYYKKVLENDYARAITQILTGYKIE